MQQTEEVRGTHGRLHARKVTDVRHIRKGLQILIQYTITLLWMKSSRFVVAAMFTWESLNFPETERSKFWMLLPPWLCSFILFRALQPQCTPRVYQPLSHQSTKLHGSSLLIQESSGVYISKGGWGGCSWANYKQAFSPWRSANKLRPVSSFFFRAVGATQHFIVWFTLLW